MQLIEGNLFYINNEKVTIQFEPSADQMQFWANNELTQSATYPSMSAGVHKSELTFIGGSIGNTEDDCKWKVPTNCMMTFNRFFGLRVIEHIRHNRIFRRQGQMRVCSITVPFP